MGMKVQRQDSLLLIPHRTGGLVHRSLPRQQGKYRVIVSEILHKSHYRLLCNRDMLLSLFFCHHNPDYRIFGELVNNHQQLTINFYSGWISEGGDRAAFPISGFHNYCPLTRYALSNFGVKASNQEDI